MESKRMDVEEKDKGLPPEGGADSSDLLIAGDKQESRVENRKGKRILVPKEEQESRERKRRWVSRIFYLFFLLAVVAVGFFWYNNPSIPSFSAQVGEEEIQVILKQGTWKTLNQAKEFPDSVLEDIAWPEDIPSVLGGSSLEFSFGRRPHRVQVSCWNEDGEQELLHITLDAVELPGIPSIYTLVVQGEYSEGTLEYALQVAVYGEAEAGQEEE